jgi:restriction system protein
VRQIDSVELSPEGFELLVKSWLDAAGRDLKAYQSFHREKVDGVNGVYEIDVKATFEEFGATFVVLAECKHHKSPIKREAVQVLYDRLRSTGSHKGIVFATTSFQRGAIEYATTHGIALVQVAEGKTSYVTKSYGPPKEPPPWANIPAHIGWLASLTEDGRQSMAIVSVENPEYLSRFFSRAQK